MNTLPLSKTVDIGYGRGRLAPKPAASLSRVDKALGRPLDVNSAWRDPVTQQRLYDAYVAYQNNEGPWAPIALKPDQSIHCKGGAIDTDDSGLVKLLNEHGWRQTVYRWINGKKVLVEPWHFEYFENEDKHINDSESIPAPAPTEEEEDDMKPRQIHYKESNGSIIRALLVPGTGYFVKWTEGGATYANRLATNMETNSSSEVTKSLFQVFEREAAAQRPKDALSIELADAN